jgi:hypothetical protein
LQSKQFDHVITPRRPSTGGEQSIRNKSVIGKMADDGKASILFTGGYIFRTPDGLLPPCITPGSKVVFT